MPSHDDDNINLYLSSVSQKLFGNRLEGIVATDSYLRQPDYSSRATLHYYLVLSTGAQCEDALALRYIGREFPAYSFNFIYTDELVYYPAHAIWQFRCSQWLFAKNDCEIAMPERDVVEESRQAIFSVYHLSRLYYIRKLDLKTHIWGVRQFGWAIRYGKRCLFDNLTTPDRSLDAQGIADRNWLIDFQENWTQRERQLANSKIAFRDALSRLSDIAGRRANALHKGSPMAALMPSQDFDLVSESIAPVVTTVKDRLARELGPSLLSFYLHGSAARGDMRAGSDIDSFVIVDRVTRGTLEIARQVQSDNPPFTISVYGLAEINHYPKFRRYALANGTKLVSGDWRLNFEFDAGDDIAGIINNVFTVRQVARSYLVEGSYGARAHYVAALMAKLIDHGCLRPTQKLVSGSYPTSRASVRSFFSDAVACTRILDFVDKLEPNEQALKEALLKGDTAPLEGLFHDLLNAADSIETRMENYAK